MSAMESLSTTLQSLGILTNRNSHSVAFQNAGILDFESPGMMRFLDCGILEFFHNRGKPVSK